LVVSSAHSFALGGMQVWRKLFLDITIYSGFPVMFDVLDDTFVIRDFGAEAD
jgi:hypothetical protein